METSLKTDEEEYRVDGLEIKEFQIETRSKKKKEIANLEKINYYQNEEVEESSSVEALEDQYAKAEEHSDSDSLNKVEEREKRKSGMITYKKSSYKAQSNGFKTREYCKGWMLKLAESKSIEDCLTDEIIEEEGLSFKENCKFILYNERMRKIWILLSKQKSKSWFDYFEFLDEDVREPKLYGYTAEKALKVLREDFVSIFENEDYHRHLEDIAKRKKRIPQRIMNGQFSQKKFLDEVTLKLLSGKLTLDEVSIQIVAEKGAAESSVIRDNLRSLKEIEVYGQTLLGKRSWRSMRK